LKTFFRWIKDRMRSGAWLLALLVALPLCLIAYKVGALNYRLEEILPRKQYRVTVDMSLDGNFGRVAVTTFLPQSDQHQQIAEEEHLADPSFRFLSENEGLNRVARWTGGAVPDGAKLSLSYSVLATPIAYDIDTGLAVPDGYSQSIAAYLKPTDNIQVDHSDVRATLREIGADGGTLRERLLRIYQRTSALRSRAFKGTTDAITALRLGEASCNGKSRLFAALARATGIPSRLVGGLILEEGQKRTSHQWVEAYVGGHWVPFDPTNDHFARLPANYLVLYHNDESLFSHTADVNFDYSLATSSKLVPAPKIRTGLSMFNVWGLFERLKLPFTLLRTILMLPVGALVVVLFRNVVGMPTFGTFLPALIAAAAGETGLFWGLISIIVVTLATVVARRVIQSMRLLHSPTLAILLAVVVITMLSTSLLADRVGLESLARVSYFPIAVMAIASERFYLSLVEQGRASAFKQLAGTLLVVLACYAVMNSLAMQALFGAFPEVLFLVIAANIYLGKWIGVRIIELWRFRSLLQQRAAA
jgi:hypothetical protein